MLDRLLRRRNRDVRHEHGEEPESVAGRIRRTAEESAQLGNYAWYASGFARKTPTGAALLAGEPEELAELTLEAFRIARTAERTGDEDERRLRSTANDLASSALRRKLPFTEDDFRRLLDELAGQARSFGYLTAGIDPVAPLIGAIERAYGAAQLAPASLHAPLRRVAELVGRDADGRKVRRRIGVLVGDADTAGPLPASGDPWTRAILAARDALGAGERQLADRILTVAGAANAAKPTKTFLAQRDTLLAEGERPNVGRIAAALLTAAAAVPGTEESGQVPPELGDRLRGLAWIGGAAGGEEAARALAHMALAGWKKVPGYGPLCQKAANAAIAALTELPEGAPQLGRIRAQLKQPTALRAVDAAIDDAAEQLGIPRAEFEERVVPDFDLDRERRRVEQLGEYTAQLELHADGSCALSFRNPAGRTLRSVPAAVRSEHADRLAELKQTAKDIKIMAAAQKSRLERLLLDDRAWRHETWRERYIDHGLVGAIARRMIWTVDGRSAIHHDGRLVTSDGSALPSPAPDATVRLWHPVDAAPDEVKAWRRFLEEREITQPFKQAHREVYLLTAAEQQTRTYSNRFAAHILRQHQMAALARGRGWRYALQGAWDQPDERATLELPQHQLTASFWVERPWDTEDWNDAGVFNHVLSDQVRFHAGTSDGVPLETIPPRVFSEVMRDVDLFVGVTSIGNDPTWAEQGERRYREYWRGYAFGELTEQADVRRDLLARLLPKLAIRDVARIDGRFLRVQGRLRAYKIHLGSGNILMEPNDEYLCIVPGGGKDAVTSKVFLPFEGDQVLAVILSKAFLLAKDDKIDDVTITSQINARR